MQRVVVPTVMAVVGLVSLAAGQAPQSTFRAGVDLVQVDVSVLDKQRQPVRGLTAADFTVLEDGKPRQVMAFTAVDLPSIVDRTTARWTRDVSPDIATNNLPDEGRLVIIVMDRTIPDGYATVSARTIAKAAISQLGPGDLAAVVFTGNGRSQDFTADRSRLLAAIDGSNPAGELSDSVAERWDTLVADLFEDMGRPPPSTMAAPGSSAQSAMDFSAQCLCGACVLETIGRIADAVRDVARRRKSLLFIGHDIQVETTESPCIDPVRKAREGMFRSLDQANLTVHAFDPVGLETLGLQAGTSTSGRAAIRGPVATRGSRLNSVRQGDISVLPDRTGGRTVLNVNDPSSRVDQIFRESDSYYLLGFEPAASDGRRHDITVKVGRRGLDVRTRRAYVANLTPAPADTPPPAVLSARKTIESTMPTREGVSLQATTMPLAVPGARDPVLAIALHVEHEANKTIHAPAGGPEQVDVVTAVFTTTGRLIGTLQQTVLVTPQVGAAGAAYDLLQRIPAKPGRYELRIGVLNHTRNQTGSVYTFVDIPNYANLPFAVSDVAVYAPKGPPAAGDNLADVLRAPPSARREFARGDRATVFLRLYQRADRQPVPVSITTRLIDEHDRQRFGLETTIATSDFDATRAADYALDLPLAEAESGSYLLRMDLKAATSIVRRDLRFVVK
jgi:VWFA-related protein